MTSHVALELAEGIELGYALVARVAEDVGARLLAIKGRVNEAHGLRSPRDSVDVDVLVEPARHADLVAALLELGWREPPKPPVPPPFGSHSVTIQHPSWPCEIDIHDRFPGFLADPADVFEELWAGRTAIEAAGVTVPATGLLGSALVMALHALRAPHDPRNARELAVLVHRLAARTVDKAGLRALAADTGCLSTARPFLRALGIDGADAAMDDPRLAQWSLRQSSAHHRNLGWLVALRRTAPWRWPVLAMTVFFSNEPHLRRYFPQTPPGRRGLWLARWWRLRAALRDLPRAWRTARRIN
ncbi:hypothetical protein JCM18899A_02970 [Nocardioides sp. AN3]